MFERKKEIKSNTIEELLKQVDKLNFVLSRNNIVQLVDLLGNRKELIKRNLISGIFRGIGIGIGVTIITSIIVWFLQKIVMLNIPIIGEYIADIVDIVQKSR